MLRLLVLVVVALGRGRDGLGGVVGSFALALVVVGRGRDRGAVAGTGRRVVGDRETRSPWFSHAGAATGSAAGGAVVVVVVSSAGAAVVVVVVSSAGAAVVVVVSPLPGAGVSGWSTTAAAAATPLTDTNATTAIATLARMNAPIPWSTDVPPEVLIRYRQFVPSSLNRAAAGMGLRCTAGARQPGADRRDGGPDGEEQLMKVHVMTGGQRLDRFADQARDAAAAGFAGLVVTESGRTPYLSIAVAAAARAGPRLRDRGGGRVPAQPDGHRVDRLGAAEATDGRFRLGLGTQVRAHIERRYATAFEHPGPRLRDYVLAVKACFAGVPGRAARPPRRVLRPLAAARDVVAGADRRAPTRPSTSRR